jgi:hypothetical protein
LHESSILVVSMLITSFIGVEELLQQENLLSDMVLYTSKLLMRRLLFSPLIFYAILIILTLNE